jgi:hypothetical protein
MALFVRCYLKSIRSRTDKASEETFRPRYRDRWFIITTLRPIVGNQIV